MRRAESPPPATVPRTSPRFEIDRAWLWRGFLVLAVVGFILVVAKALMMMVGSGNMRLEEHDRAIDRPAATQPASPAKPSPSPSR
jgi:hypothetical protein